MIGFVLHFFENLDTQETSSIPTKSPQNLSPRRFRHAESESEVENLEILHPDLEIKENHPPKKNPIIGLVHSSSLVLLLSTL